MPVYLSTLCAAVLTVLCASVAGGQDLLTLTDAQRQALAQNASLSAARLAADEASARGGVERAGFAPRIIASEGWQRGNAPVFVFGSLLSARQFSAANFAIDALNHPEPTGFFHGSVAVEQLIFDGGRTAARVRSARQSAEIADATAREAALALTALVAEAYGRVLRADAQVKASQAAVDAAIEDEARAIRRRDAGTVTEADVLALSVHRAAMQQRRIQASGDAAIARAELNRLRGAAIDAPIGVVEPAPRASAGERDVAQLTAQALQARPDVVRQESAVALAESGRRLARSAWMPQVAAQGAVQADGTSFADRASAWMVGGEVRWSISTGGAERAGQRAAALAASRARALRDDVRAAAAVEVLTAVRQFESAEGREQVGRATVDQARERQRIVRDRYDAGMAGVQDVLAAAAAVLEAETLRVSALVDRVAADAGLDRALGRLP